ncbi:pre-mRNA-splicing regulator female-lethal(2)D isoform X2 [Atheta coriaria]
MTEHGDAATEAPTHVQNGGVEQSTDAVAASRVTVTESELHTLTAADWTHKWQQQDIYVSAIEKRLILQEGELSDLRQNYERTKVQLTESQQREKLLVRRLAAKEQEMQDYVCQVTELKTSQAPTTASLRSTLLDPAVNSLLQLLRAELQKTKAKLEETQNDLSAWKFTPDSNTGKRLMAKCRLLYQENEDLGKITSSGRIAILEGDLALQKKFTEEVRQSQLELDSFLADFDEDVEGMQSTIMFLQQELRRTKDAASALQKENAALRALNGGETAPESEPPTNGDGGVLRANGDSSDVRDHDIHADDDERTTRVKRVRRSSVLSIDYNDEDMCNTNGDSAMISDAELTQ